MKFGESTTNSANFQPVYVVCSSDLISCHDDQDNVYPETTSTSSNIAEATTLRDRTIVTINDLQKDFFLESALVEGGRMTLAENLYDPAPKKAFLTASAVAKLPSLTSANVNQLLQHFNVARNSHMATHMATAAYLCGSAPLPGEARTCAASRDAMAAFVSSELGQDVKLYTTTGAPTTAPAAKAPVTIVNVVIGSIAEGKKIVVCHHIAFPSALFYCHSVTGTKIVQALLKPDSVTSGTTAPIIHSAGVCHINTALWLSRHPAFKSLHVPKGSEVCHFLAANDIVFAPEMTEVVE